MYLEESHCPETPRSLYQLHPLWLSLDIHSRSSFLINWLQNNYDFHAKDLQVFVKESVKGCKELEDMREGSIP